MNAGDTAAASFGPAGLMVFERGWLSSNSVLFLGTPGSPSTLVDTGYVSHAGQTLSLVSHALRGQPLQRIVNTHLHSDHCGGNAVLQAAHACEVWVPAGEWDKVTPWDDGQLSYVATGQYCPAFRASGRLHAGDELGLGGRLWRVLAAPGHDPESIMLYQADERTLISADALWENGFGVVFPEIEGISAFDDVAATLDLLSSLRVDWVVPGHGRPFSDVSGALARARSRLAAFRSDPRKHASHAAKVLLKFHLLEVRRQPGAELHAWARGVPYLRLLHQAHFAERGFQDWLDERLRELLAASALNFVDGDWLDA